MNCSAAKKLERNTIGTLVNLVGVEAWAELFEHSTEHVVVFGEAGQVLFANPSWCAALQQEPVRSSQLHLRDILPANELLRWNRWLERPRSLQRDVLIRSAWLTRDREEIPMEGSLCPIDDGTFGVRLLGIFQDARRLAGTRAKLGETEGLLHVLTTYAPIGIFQMDQRGHLLHTNARWRKIAGFQHAQEPHGVWWQMVETNDRPEVLAQWESFLRNGHEFLSEFRVQAAANSQHYARVRIVQTQSDAPQGVACVGVAEDITERRHLETERLAMEAHLRQQQKLESIGTLASGVAHEINNPMTGIMNYAEIIRDELPADSEIQKHVAEIIHEGERVTTIVHSLLTFARQEKQVHAPEPLHTIIEETLSLIRTVIKRDQITLNVLVPKNLPLINCRSQQIQQVLMNLVTNGRDALNEKYPGYNPNKKLEVRSAKFNRNGGLWVRITVEDHGTGIPPEVVERMYEPFYTTKGRRKGTGLGLSISRGIVQDHHGELRVETEPGEYTRFHIELPALESVDLGDAADV